MRVQEDAEPTRAHLFLLAVYTGAVATGAALLSRRRRLALPTAGDIALLGIATFKLSRLLTREKVTQGIRQPFADAGEHSGGSEVLPSPKGKGVQRAIGELLSCPFCASVWIGTAGAFSFAAAPDATRLAASALTAMAVADAAQYGLAGLRRME